MNRQSHWNHIYQTKKANEVSWFTPHLAKSLELVHQLHLDLAKPVIDVGGGASTLADDLLGEGFKEVTVLDVSKESLELAKQRLGSAASGVQWLAQDITQAHLPSDHFFLWHDRAVFHFLTEEKDRRAYKKILFDALHPEGFAILAAFSLSGPLKCSGLDIVRYSPETLLKELGQDFILKTSLHESHQTPSGNTQDFIYCVFQKKWNTKATV